MANEYQLPYTGEELERRLSNVPFNIKDAEGNNAIAQNSALAANVNATAFGISHGTKNEDGSYNLELTVTRGASESGEGVETITYNSSTGGGGGSEPAVDPEDTPDEYKTYTDAEKTPIQSNYDVVYKTTGAHGINSHTEGFENLATGPFSHAEGYRSYAATQGSHVEGTKNITFGLDSHAEGFKNTTYAQATHVEGGRNNAHGKGSHIEGFENHTSEDAVWSHAEGQTNIVKSQAAHAEGRETVVEVEANYAHTEGLKTKAANEAAHAEGHGTTAKGKRSHAEGNNTTAIGEASHAEGASSSKAPIASITSATAAVTAFNNASSKFTTTYGTGSHAEGYNTLGLGKAAHSEGEETVAKGNHSHAEGYRTIAVGKYQHVQGRYNLEDSLTDSDMGRYAHIVGGGTSATKRANLHTIGWNGDGHFAGDVYINYDWEKQTGTKLGDIASSLDLNLVNGTNTRSLKQIGASAASGTSSAAFGVNTSAKGLGSFAEGLGASAVGDADHAEGRQTTARGGVGAHAEGFSTNFAPPIESMTVYTACTEHRIAPFTLAFCDGAHAEGKDTLALSIGAHAEGHQTVAKGNQAHAEGWNTIASGEHQHVQGHYNLEDLDNKYSHIVGGGTSVTRANIHTLDWEGTGWFKKGIKVGGYSQDDPLAYNVITMANVDQLEAGFTDSTTLVLSPGYWLFNLEERKMVNGSPGDVIGRYTFILGVRYSRYTSTIPNQSINTYSTSSGDHVLVYNEYNGSTSIKKYNPGLGDLPPSWSSLATHFSGTAIKLNTAI